MPPGNAMPEFRFTLVLQGADVLAPANLDALFEAGCDDATFGDVDGVPFADFSRRSGSAAEAIESAIRAVESAIPGLTVVRVEPDDLVTAAEIAARLGRTRESVRLLIAGRRGPGGFPAPATHLRSRGRLWRWSGVSRWVTTSLGEASPGGESPAFVGALNSALALARLDCEVTDPDERQLVSRALAGSGFVARPTHASRSSRFTASWRPKLGSILRQPRLSVGEFTELP